MGIGTHEKMHYSEMQDEKENVLWHGRFENSKKGFESILQKMGKIEGGQFQQNRGNIHESSRQLPCSIEVFP